MYADFETVELLMTNTKIVTPVVAKVLATMKPREQSRFVISPDYVKEHDPEFTFVKTQDRDSSHDPSKPILIEATVHKMNKVEDLYNDKKVFYKTLRQGEGTEQPYFDCTVVLKVSIEIDGKLQFHHKDPLSIDYDIPNFHKETDD